MEEQKSVGGWESYINNFLKADDVKSEEEAFACVNAEEVSFGNETSVRLHLERSPDKFLFDLNKTNAVFLKDDCKIKHPKEIVGKKLYFTKVKVMNPQTKKEVDGLRINKLE